MKNLKGRCVFAQSGGPTAVINAGIAGGILSALKNPNVTGVLCANHGIKGVLTEDFFDMSKEDENEILALKTLLPRRSARYGTDLPILKKTIPITKKYSKCSKNTT